MRTGRYAVFIIMILGVRGGHYWYSVHRTRAFCRHERGRVRKRSIVHQRLIVLSQLLSHCTPPVPQSRPLLHFLPVVDVLIGPESLLVSLLHF